ncbi:MAG: hypothetical protein QHJ34_01720 [bacterium]|jgi:ABC-2 type transport system permease protein|nr:hypothetical protein [candidate division KSB1 bacterium]MDH7558937.1 hypothetical protein [bacterium]
MLLFLLRNRLRMYINLLRRVEGTRRLRTVLLVALWLFFVGYVFQGTQAMFQAIAQVAGPQATGKVLAVLLFALLVALLLSGTTICIHILFVSQDLPLLLSAPIRRRTLFLYKLVEATVSNSSMFLMLGFPLLLSFGAAQNAAWWYYPLMLAVATVFVAVPTSLSAMVALLAVHLLPVRRAQEVMSVALALVFLAVWTGMQLLRSSLDASGPGGVTGLLALTRSNLFAVTPAGWAATIIAGLLAGHWTSASLAAVLLAGSTAAMIVVSVALVDSIYARGVGKEEAAPLSRGSEVPSRRLARAGHAGSLFRAAFLRDARLLRREPTQLMQLVMLAAMMVVMTFILKRDTEGEQLSRLELLMPLIFVVLFSAMSTVGIAARLIPLEGKAFYLTKIAPQRPTRLLAAKLSLAWLLGTTVALFGTVVVTILFAHPLSRGLGAFGLASLVCLGTGGLGLLLGAYFADFDWESPKRMITVGGGLLSAVVPLVYLALLGGLGALVYLLAHTLLGAEQVVALLCGALVLLSLSIGAAAASLLAAGRRVDTMAWLH